ncbi:Ig-like domain-containing protein, partial [Xenorhabdus littoralis]|uniref:Ig-like domain-containing protein n=1 Tax=Xenorhabdus littoralis TaxID=2582835 RepID=UPI0029E7F68D
KPAPTTATNDKGQLEAALVSSKPVKEAKVFLQAGGMEKTQVGAVSFEDNPALFHIETVDVLPKVPSQVADGKQIYTYTATVLGGDGKPVVNQKISNVKWSIDKSNKELIWAPRNGDVTTNEKGELTATLASHAEVKNITVSLAIGNKSPVQVPYSVSFTDNPALFHIGGRAVDVSPKVPSQVGDSKHIYTYTATVLGGDGKPVVNQKIYNVKWSIDNNSEWLIWNPPNGDVTTNEKGELTATLASFAEVDNIMVSLAIGKQPPVDAVQTVSFTPLYVIKGGTVHDIEPKDTTTLPVGEYFTFKALLVDNSTHIPQRNTTLPVVEWDFWLSPYLDKPLDPSQRANITFKDSGRTTDSEGYFTLTFTSKAAIKNVTASIRIVDKNRNMIPSTPPVSFEDNPKDYHVKDNHIAVESTPPGNKVLTSDGKQKFTYTAVVVGSDSQPLEEGTEIDNVLWEIDPNGKTGLNFEPENGTVKAGKDGKLTATITSAVNTPTSPFVVVTASTDNNVKGADKEPVQFMWPLLNTPEITPPNVVVPPK